MASMLLLNPRRRRRKAASSHRKHKRRSRRRMTAKQLMYFGKRRHRRSARGGSRARRRVRRSRVVVVNANPIRKRRHRRRGSVARHRRYRRNPISLPSGMRASLGSIKRVATNAAIGGAGAVLTDIVMGYALKFAPDSLVARVGSRYGANGGPNWSYYAAKVPLAIALGVGGSMFLPGRMKGYAAQAAEGALTVAAYEILRLTLPANITMGYYNSARVVSGGVPQSRLAAYTNRRLAGMGGGSPAGSLATTPGSRETRVGEGQIS